MAFDMNVAALGRPFALGMLYDACEDRMITGLTLWDTKTLEKITDSKLQHSSSFVTSASDTMNSKSNLLDIEASLKASFMSGLVEVGGSAKYLNDTKKSKNQARLTFQYKATTNFKHLLIDNLSIGDKQRAMIEKTSATHIVTGITYGANAFFVFDSEQLDSSSVQEIQGSMEAVIKKIPSFIIEGKVKINLNYKEEEMTNKFTCKFYGDFILDKNPATFKDAVQTFVDLPDLLGPNGEKSVPVKVWLTPLRNLNLKTAELKGQISIGLLMKMEEALEELREVDMRCNDSLNDSVVQNFPQVHKELSKFKKLCDAYATKLKKTMAEKVPSIREGKEDERSLEQLFDDRDKSPFSNEKLTEWLDHKKGQISVIKSCVEDSGEIKFVRNESALMREAVSVEHALCFVFTFLESADPCLDVMTDYFDSTTVQSTHEHPWYNLREVLTKMQEKAEAFRNLAEKLKKDKRFRFLIAAIENEKYKGATIYHYKNGSLVTEDFSKPLPVREITDKRDLIWYATDLTLDPNTANGYLTLSDGDKKATCAPWSYYPDHPERFDKHTQVLCREELKGRHYWEVEWNTSSEESIYICAAYKGVQRKGDSKDGELGCNPISWTFGKMADRYKTEFRAWHNGLRWSGPIPSLCNRVGVFLDLPAGTLSFYQVMSNRLTHLYTFDTHFNEPLYPGLWAYHYGNYAYLCPVE